MARYTDAVCRLCRREGMKLYLKGERCFKEKCSFETRKGKIPGQHGAGKIKKPTGYALQLREKQKVKRIYGVLEKQFRHYFEKADAKKGVTGHNLLGFLECRLDNVVFRLGFASSRSAARQMVMHGHVLVNGSRVDIPSFQVKPGQAVELGKRARDATVTRADLDYVGSITLDPLLMEAAGFLENEKVDIYDVTNGSRLSTYVIPGAAGSGEVGINGAAAHLVRQGDLVIIAAYGWMTAEEAGISAPRVVFVDERNRVTERRTQERTPLHAAAFPD